MTLTKKISKNTNIKSNPVTTSIGFIFTFFGLSLLTIPIFYEVKTTLEWYVPLILIILGVVLIISPDDFLSIVKKGTNKITKNETES